MTRTVTITREVTIEVELTATVEYDPGDRCTPPSECIGPWNFDNAAALVAIAKALSDDWDAIEEEFSEAAAEQGE